MQTILNTGIDLAREERAQDGTEWRFGATSTDCLFDVPPNERREYLPIGEAQNTTFEKQDCVTRGYLNILETKFNYAYRNDVMKPENKKWLKHNEYVIEKDGKEYVEFSDHFIAILSNTKPSGNSLKEPAHAIHKYGLVPKSMMIDGDSWESHYDSKNITPSLLKLGQDFLKRFNIYYEKIPTTDLQEVLKLDLPNVAGHAWNGVENGVYVPTDAPPNHVFMLFYPGLYAFDNYPATFTDENRWIKKLSPHFNFYSHGYRIFVTIEKVGDRKKQNFFWWFLKDIFS